MRSSQLRHELTALRGSGTHRDGPGELWDPGTRGDGMPSTKLAGRVSRRALLSRAGPAAVAAAAAGLLLNPREAKADIDVFDVIDANRVNVFQTGIFAQHTSPGRALYAKTTSTSSAAVFGINDGGSGPGVEGRNAGTGAAVEGVASGVGGTGVKGTGRIGVWGESNQAGFYGVFGRNTNADGTGVRAVGDTGAWGSSSRSGFSGVYGQHTGTSGFGIVGDGKGEGGAGVLGRNNDGTGVWGKSAKAGYGGVTAEHTGSAGFGVIGLGKGATGAGVLGRNSGGYGGQFEGGKAQLKLGPGSSAGKPTGAHTKGEIFMDSAATLFVCTADGTPGTWRRVQTAAV